MLNRVLCWGMFLLLLTACTPLRLQQNPPKVQLESLLLLPPEGLSQRFEVGLRVMNVDSHPLVIQGLHLELALNGHDLLAGVSPSQVTIESYSEATMRIQLATNVLSALGFLNDWLNRTDQTRLQYDLKASVDVQGSLLNLSTRQSGEVDLKRFTPAR